VVVKKLSPFFAFFLFSFSLLFCAQQEQPVSTNSLQQDVLQKEHVPNSWDKVSTLYLPSFVDKAEKQKVLNQLSAARNQTNQQTQNLEKARPKRESEELESALTPDATDYIKQVFSHFAYQESSATNLHEDSKVVFDDTTYRDLNVFCGKEETPEISLFNFIDHTQTIAGRASLLDMLYNPLIDVQSLMARQNGIKSLVENERVYASIQERLMTIKNAEQILFIMLNELHFKLISNITDRFYLKSVFDLPVISFITAFPFISMIRMVDTLPWMKKINANACDKFNKNASLLEYIRFQNYFSDIVILPVTLLALDAAFGYFAYEEIKKHDYHNAAMWGGIFGSFLFVTPLLLQETYKTTIDKLKTENMLHETVGLLAKMATALKELKKIVAQHPELTTLVPCKDIEKEAHESHSELKELLVLLDDENFKEIADWKTFKGKMMAAFKFLSTLKYEFVQPYLEIGKLDALMSVATLYKKHANDLNARYFFADYEQQLMPHLLLNDFWNPFITDKDTIVTNSLELGTKTAYRNILITGPNQGGKSTALKSIAFAVLLAQTLTIANGKIVFTPFVKTFTTLNITDTTGKESLYQADKNRIKCVTSTAARLDTHEKALLISDEMFNTTGASYGAALFYGTLIYIDGSLKNTLFAAATHFETLVEIEQDTQGSVANFRVEEATPGADGKLTWTYKIKPGINKQNISFELAQEDGFDPKILEAGKKLLERHNSKSR